MTSHDVGLPATHPWYGHSPAEFDLPPRLRLLCIGAEEPSWVGLTLRLDAEDCLEPHFRWVSTASEALNLLRCENFDCIIVAQPRRPVHSPTEPAFEATRTDASKADANWTDADTADPHTADPNPTHEKTADASTGDLLRAIRASGCDDAIVLLTAAADDDHWPEVVQNQCELLVSPKLWESPALVPVVKRAVAHVHLVRENHQLSLANQRRLVRERDEAEHLMNQQRQMIQELQSVSRRHERATGESASPADRAASSEPRSRLNLPEQIGGYYQELLRTYVIMGSGSLGGEIAGLAEVLSVAGLSPRETLELHLERVESLVRGLGNRSARHVMARADLLALELMVHLGECYQRGRAA